MTFLAQLAVLATHSLSFLIMIVIFLFQWLDRLNSSKNIIKFDSLPEKNDNLRKLKLYTAGVGTRTGFYVLVLFRDFEQKYVLVHL